LAVLQLRAQAKALARLTQAAVGVLLRANCRRRRLLAPFRAWAAAAGASLAALLDQVKALLRHYSGSINRLNRAFTAGASLAALLDQVV
jgi:hypothetical protein